MNLGNATKALSLGLATFGVSAIAQAGVIAYESAAEVYFSEVDGVTTIDFEGNTCGYVSCVGDFQVRESLGYTNDHSAPTPATDTGEYYLTVPNPYQSGTASFSLDDDYNYFGMFWGSIDDYNTISFLADGSEVGSFTGSELAPLVDDGNQSSWDSNRFINFSFTDGDFFDTVVLTSTNWAFETDNHAYGNVSVPEPTTLGLLAIGIAGIGAARRRKAS